MRGFTRSQSPECLTKKGLEWTNRWEPRLQNGQKLVWPQFELKRIDEILARHLRADTQAHCSYCDQIITYETADEQLDHFQPKSYYPELAFTWSNLFLSCTECNSEKRAQYSELLLRTDAIAYSFSKFFRYNPSNGILEVSPEASDEERKQAETTLDILGLNKGGRPTSRWRTFKTSYRGYEEGDSNIDELSYRFIFEP